MRTIVLLVLALFAASAAQAQPGIAYYSNGRQDYFSFEEIRSLPFGALRAKLQDIRLHTDWLKSYDEGPLKSPGLYASVVRETIEQAADVAQALRAAEKNVDACEGRFACIHDAVHFNAELEARAAEVDDFRRAFEALRDGEGK